MRFIKSGFFFLTQNVHETIDIICAGILDFFVHLRNNFGPFT